MSAALALELPAMLDRRNWSGGHPPRHGSLRMPETAKIDDQSQAKDNALPDKTHNLPTQEEFLQYVARHVVLENEINKLKKKKTLMRREMKNAGIDCQTFDAVRKLHAIGDEAIEDQMRQLTRYMQYMNLPIGTQMGFFDEQPQEQTTDVVAKALKEGKVAGMMGGNMDDNPHELNTDAGQEWQKGYNEGQAVLKQQLLDHNASLAA